MLSSLLRLSLEVWALLQVSSMFPFSFFLKDRFLQVPALYDYMTLGNL